jgi:gas vesicle protein GvpA/GvpJ/GvpM family
VKRPEGKRPSVRRPAPDRPQPPKGVKRSTMAALHGRSTVPADRPASARPQRRVATPSPAIRAPKALFAPRRDVGRIIGDEEGSLLDLIDNLLSKGVMLNADLILALADVDLIYIRLSALLCAADRVLPGVRSRTARGRSAGQASAGQAPPRPR